jgi:adenylate cyclase
VSSKHMVIVGGGTGRLVVGNEPRPILCMPNLTGVYQFGPFQLDAPERRLLRDGVQVPLRLKSFETLRMLVENAGRLVTKEALLRQVWPDAMVEENNINANVSILRKALGEDANGQSYIETVPRVGYRFVAQVAQISSPQSAPPTSGDAVPEFEPEKSVAVLYFENLSGDKEDEYFRDGMTEDVITELAKIKDLRLFPRSAVLVFRDKPLPVIQVGQQLRAAFVLEGSVRRAGSRLRITARLAETRTGHSVWAERYDRQLEDVFTIQDEIAQNIARALRVMLSDKERREIEKVPTRDVQAYDYYLRGRQVVYQFRRQGLEFARQMFARAIVIDPSYAAAFAGVADCSSFLYMYFEATENNLREAATASRRAVELDPESAEAHTSRGLAESLRKNYQEADKEFKAAMLLSPELFDPCYLYARSLFAQGNMKEAVDWFEKASGLNPADYQALSHLGMCLRSLDRQVEAHKANEDALRVMERHVELYPEDARALYLGATALLLHGDRDRCLEWLGRALAIDPEETTILYNAACTYSLLGEKDQALDLIEKAVRNGYGHKEWLENDPDFASLHDHPRFQALIQRLSVASTKSTL